MTPVQAGWRTIDEPTTGPAPCAGSGQTVAPWADRAPDCPTCGRRLLTTADGTIPTHLPPAEPAPTLSLWESAR